MKCWSCGKFQKRLVRCWVVKVLDFRNLCEHCLPTYRPGPKSSPYEGLK